MKIKNLFLSTLFASSLLAVGTIAPAAADHNNYSKAQCANQGYYQSYGQTTGRYQNKPVYYQRGQRVQTVYAPATSTSSNQTYRYQVEPVQGQSSFAQEVLRLTNQARARYGLRPLQTHQALQIAAVSHSQEMLDLDYFSHNSPTPGRSQPEQRVRLAGASPRMVAENIFQCSGYDAQSAAQLAIDNWLESPGHRQNILDPKATHLGIGFVEKNGTIAVTQVFGGDL